MEGVDGKYVPPQLRTARIGASTIPNSNKDIVDRRIRGLLNRISEENVKSETSISHTFVLAQTLWTEIVEEIVYMYTSMGRNFVCQAIAREITKVHHFP